MEMRKQGAGTGIEKTFVQEGKIALKRYWLMLIYLVLFMAGFNFMVRTLPASGCSLTPFGSPTEVKTSTQRCCRISFSSAPTLLPSPKSLQISVQSPVEPLSGTAPSSSVADSVSWPVGALLPDESSATDCPPRLPVCVLGGALLYPYGFLTDERIMAVAFFEQFAVQGAWGVIPIHLMELSPASFRTFVVGTSYQLGNLISSASSTIEATAGERFPLPPTSTGVKRYVYGKVIAIFLGAVFVRRDVRSPVVVLTRGLFTGVRSAFDVPRPRAQRSRNGGQ